MSTEKDCIRKNKQSPVRINTFMPLQRRMGFSCEDGKGSHSLAICNDDMKRSFPALDPEYAVSYVGPC